MSTDSERTFFELAAITRAVGVSSRFSKVLSDPNLPITVKVQLLGDVTGGALDPAGLSAEVLSKAFTTLRPNASLGDQLLSATADAAFTAATESGRMPALESSLLGFADLVNHTGELRMAFSNPGTTDAHKHLLVDDLLGGKLDRLAITLLHVLVDLHHGTGIDEQAKVLGERAADRQGHVVAEVKSAIELDDVYRDRVATVLSQALGRAVRPRFSVDPTIVGSLVVRVGDEVWDGSVRRRLEQAREALVGAP